MSDINTNITTKKPLATSEIGQLKAVQLDPQGSNPLSSNQGIYTDASNELVYRDGTNTVQITSGGSVNAGGGPATGISTTTTANVFIDNDNNSTTERFNIYNNVTVASAGDLLIAFAENKQHSFGSDTPFTNVYSASGDFAATDKGLHIKNTGGSEVSHLILESTNTGGGMYIGRNAALPLRFYEDSANASWKIDRMQADLTTVDSRILQLMPNAANPGGIAVGFSLSGGVNQGIHVGTADNVNSLILRNVVSGTPHLTGALMSNSNSGGALSTRYWQCNVIPTDGANPTLLAMAFRANDSSLGGLVGVGTTNPTYQFEINRMNAGTQIVRAGGSSNSTTTGNTLQVYRNLASASTNSSVTFIHNDNSGDDQIALEVRQDGTGAIADFKDDTTSVLTIADGGVTTFGKAFNSNVLSTAVSATTAGQRIILVTDTAAPRTITLATADTVNGREIIIKDASGAALVNNITIDTEGAQTIDGAADVTINTNYGVFRLVSNGTNWFTI